MGFKDKIKKGNGFTGSVPFKCDYCLEHAFTSKTCYPGADVCVKYTTWCKDGK